MSFLCQVKQREKQKLSSFRNQIVIEIKGMIRNISESQKMLKFQNRVLDTIARVLKQNKTDNIYIIAFLQLISFFPCISTMFLNNPLEPLQANYIFKIFIISEIPKIWKFQPKLMLVILLVILSFGIITLFLNLANSPFKQFVTILAYFVQFLKIFSVPLLGLVLENLVDVIKTQEKVGWLAVQIMFCIQATVLLIFTAIFTFFEIRPLRYSNLLWNFSNEKQFYHIILSYARTILIFYDGVSPIFVCVSLAAELWVMRQKEVCLNPQVVVFSSLKSILITIVHVILLFNLIFKQKQLGLILLFLSATIAVVVSFLSFISIQQMAQDLPECTFENCAGMYNFYIGFWFKSKSTKDDVTKVNHHHLFCNYKDCAFRNSKEEGSAKVNDSQIQQRIGFFLKSFRYSSPESELMYEFWKIENNKSITLSHKMRKFSLPHRFAILYVLGPETSDHKKQFGVNESINKGLSSNSFDSKWKFYKQLSSAVSMFEKMGEAMTKAEPELKQLINSVIGIHTETISLNKVFQEMVKTKEVNFTCVELYIKYLQSFLHQAQLPSDIMQKFKRLKVLSHSDAIQQNPLPCFIVESFRKTVDKVNAQSLKFLKLQRFQIKDKVFTNFILPELSLKQLQSIQNENSEMQEFIPVFFHTKTQGSTSMVSRNIKIKTISVGNKSYFEIVVHKGNKNPYAIELLVDHSQKMKAFSQNTLTLKFGKQKQVKSIQTVFDENIRPLLSGMNLSQVYRIDFGKGCLMSGLVIQKYCPYPGMRLIALNLVKKANPIRNTKKMTLIRLTKIYNNQTDLCFNYREDEKSALTLEYSHVKKNEGLILSSCSQEMHNLNEHFNNFIESIATTEPTRYALGIKAYRLYEKELYNIDLQDKSKYEDEFQGLEAKSDKEESIFQFNSYCFLAGLVLSSFMIIGASIFLQISISSLLEIVETEQTKFMEIEEFNLNFYRILSILRDVSNGLYQEFGRDYHRDIMDSYYDLQKLNIGQLFTYQSYVAQFQGLSYKGALCQLIQVSLTYVYEFLNSDDKETIEAIHNFAIGQLGPKIIDQTTRRLNFIMETKQIIQFQSFVLFLVCSLAAVLYFVFFVLIAKKKKKDLNAFLGEVLIISENQIRRVLQQCERFNSAVSSLYKNYEVDLQNIGSKKEKISKRVKPKVTNFGFSSIILEIILSFSLMLSFISLSYYQFQEITTESKYNTKSFIEGYSVIGLYAEIVWLTNEIEHTGFIDYAKMDLISEKLTVIENNKFEYEFSEHVEQEIIEVFFEDSCTTLVEEQVVDEEWCGKSFKGFEIENPLSFTLDMYFRRLQYNLVVNITDTFACTGIYSEPFKHIFMHISEKLKVDIHFKLQNSMASIFQISIGTIFVGCFMFLLIIAYLVYHRNVISTMNQALATLRIGEENKKTKEEQKSKETKNKEAAGYGEKNESIAHIAEELSGYGKQESRRV